MNLVTQIRKQSLGTGINYSAEIQSPVRVDYRILMETEGYYNCDFHLSSFFCVVTNSSLTGFYNIIRMSLILHFFLSLLFSLRFVCVYF